MVEEVDIAKVISDDLNVSVDFSKVTRRKHKKTAPHVQAEANLRVGDNSHVNSINSKHDVIEQMFGVSFKSVSDLDLFSRELDEGKHPIWTTLDSGTRSQFTEAMCGIFEAFKLDMQANATNSLVAETVCEGVNVSIPRRVVEKVSTRLGYTLYGYFIGYRIAFPVVEYYVRNNWAKYGLKKIMMNAKGFFFFKFDTQAGLEAVLEEGPWMIRKSPIILKKWSIDTCLCKEELTRIPIWVKLHDVPIQIFEDDGINLIASFIGKPIMMDSYTSSMCKDSWGRSSFARCLIEVGSEDELVEAITVGIPSLNGDGFTKESIRVEYEWRPPRCASCKIFGHIYEHCNKKVITPHVATTSNVVNPPAMHDNHGFQKVSHKKKKDKAQSGKGSHVGTSIKQTFRYEPKKTTSEPQKGATIRSSVPTSSFMLQSKGSSFKEGEVSTSNAYAALTTEEDGEDDYVENMFDESANLFTTSTKGGSSSFTIAVG